MYTYSICNNLDIFNLNIFEWISQSDYLMDASDVNNVVSEPTIIVKNRLNEQEEVLESHAFITSQSDCGKRYRLRLSKSNSQHKWIPDGEDFIQELPTIEQEAKVLNVVQQLIMSNSLTVESPNFSHDEVLSIWQSDTGKHHILVPGIIEMVTQTLWEKYVDGIGVAFTVQTIDRENLLEINFLCNGDTIFFTNFDY